MKYFRAAIAALSTYSKVPMPNISWDNTTMHSAIAFLPLPGIVIGLAVWLLYIASSFLSIGPLLFAASATAIPVLITGGIHIDGYADTQDAIASWSDKEKRLEILKDPHIGAFALINVCIYLIVKTGLFSELYAQGISLYSVIGIYTMSRCVTAWSTVVIKNAKKDGMLSDFTKDVNKKAVYIILSIFTILSTTALFAGQGIYALVAIAACIAAFIWYYKLVYKYFGGATGDTSGYFLQILELLLLIVTVVGQIITRI